MHPSFITCKADLDLGLPETELATPLHANQRPEWVHMLNKSPLLSEGVLLVSRIRTPYCISILLAKHRSESFLKFLLSPASCFSVFFFFLTKEKKSLFYLLAKGLLYHISLKWVCRVKTQYTYGVVMSTVHRPLAPWPLSRLSSPLWGRASG